MTGFGRATVEAGDRRLRVEIRSVNHRGLDLKMRDAEARCLCDAEMARAVRAAVERGAVTVHDPRGGRRPARRASTRRGVAAIYASLERLRRAGDDGAGRRWRRRRRSWRRAGGVLVRRSAVGGAAAGGTAALGELRATRAREGAALAADLEAPRRHASRSRRAEDATATLPRRFARRLEERLAALREPARVRPGAAGAGGGADGRAARRHRGADPPRHPPRARRAAPARAAGAIGRKLDFVIQEIGRELNTVGPRRRRRRRRAGHRREGGAREAARAGAKRRVMVEFGRR